MSKLIVEMPMPYRCPCVLAVDNNGWFSPCFACYYGIPSREKDFDDCIENGTRPDWCPIIGVLPDEHGRLIDASAIIGIQQDEEDNDVPVTVDDYLGLQFPVPTVVPATERSKHGTTAG